MSKVDNEEFVKAWATSNTTSEIARKTGMTKDQISSRARYLRQKGVKLSPLFATRNRIDVDRLNALVMGAKAGKL